MPSPVSALGSAARARRLDPNLRYVFTGHRAANKAAHAAGAKLVNVARLAGVSTGTVSNVLNRPETVPDSTRGKVAAAIAELGYVRGGPATAQLGSRYSHITAAMRRALCDALTEQWNAALRARKALAPRSPVGVLDRLLQAL